MSNLKSFLWNNKTYTSIKSKYNNKQFSLIEWPDFGFVGCPSDYIKLSAYLMQSTLNYNQLLKLTNNDKESTNHFIYVCRMLNIIKVSEAPEVSTGQKFMHMFNTDISGKLKALFF